MTKVKEADFSMPSSTAGFYIRENSDMLGDYILGAPL